MIVPFKKREHIKPQLGLGYLFLDTENNNTLTLGETYEVEEPKQEGENTILVKVKKVKFTVYKIQE